MKKKLSFILVFALLLGLCACGGGSASESLEAMKLSDEPYVYPVLPGTAEWESFPDSAARRRACYVDRETAEGLSTRALLITVMDYPFFGDFDTFNDPMARLITFVDEFPPMTVLSERTDAIEVVRAYTEEVEQYDESGKLNLDWYDSRTILSLLEYLKEE